MKKLLSVFLVLTLLLLVPAAAYADGSSFITVATTNLRYGPGQEYSIGETVSKGTSLSYAYDSDYDGRGVLWYRVYYMGCTYWVSSNQVTRSSYSDESGSFSSEDYVQVVTDANLRLGAGLEYSIAATVSEGTYLTFLGGTRTDSRGVCWFEVRYSGMTCWISSNCSRLVSSAEPETRTIVVTTAVNLREGPGLYFNTITTVPEGAYLVYTENFERDSRNVVWYNVAYRGIYGWVSSKYTHVFQ